MTLSYKAYKLLVKAKGILAYMEDVEEENFARGVDAAGKRMREQWMQLKKLCDESRKHIQLIRNGRKAGKIPKVAPSKVEKKYRKEEDVDKKKVVKKKKGVKKKVVKRKRMRL